MISLRGIRRPSGETVEIEYDRSLPNRVKIHAEEIAARWDVDLGYAAVPIKGVDIHRWFWTSFEIENTLDLEVGESGYSVGPPGLSTSELTTDDNHESFDKNTNNYFPGVYVDRITMPLGGAPPFIIGQWIHPGSVLYVLFYGGGPPTVGSTTEVLVFG